SGGVAQGSRAARGGGPKVPLGFVTMLVGREDMQTAPGARSGAYLLPVRFQDERSTMAHRPGPISRLLMADHRRLDTLLHRAFDNPRAIDHVAYAAFRKGLLRHIGMEEKILLPAAQRARGGEALPCAARLRLDHGALAALLVPPPTRAIGHTLRTILERHNALEEGPEGAYEACERL